MQLYRVTGQKTGINCLVLAHNEAEAIAIALTHENLSPALKALVLSRLTANRLDLSQYADPKYLLG